MSTVVLDLAMKLLFLGSDRFSVLSLKSFLANCKNVSSLEVITNQKGSCLDLEARKLGLAVNYCLSKSMLNALPDFPWKKFDLGVVSSFGLFIPSRIINSLPLINIHPSILPQFRGPAPLQYTILGGSSQSGVSIIDLHPKTIDAGSILIQETYPVSPDVWYHELEADLARLGGELVAQVSLNFQQYWNGKREQCGTISQTSKFTKSDGLVSFKTHSFEQICRKIRALSHQIPIKCEDLVPSHTVFLEDFILMPSKLAKMASKKVFYDKPTGTLYFPIEKELNQYLGVKRFKIDGKSQIYPAGSFYSNFLKPDLTPVA